MEQYLTYVYKGQVSKLIADIEHWRKVENHFKEHNERYNKRKEPRGKRSS